MATVKLITKEDERRIKKNQESVISMLRRSNLVVENSSFFEDLQSKIESQNRIEREKRESEKSFAKRRKEQLRESMACYFEGYFTAMVGEVYPEIWNTPLYMEYRIFEPVAKWIVETFTREYPTREEYEKQYFDTIYEKVYHHIYDDFITRPKRREKRLKGVKKSLWEDVRNANKNAT